MQKNKSKIALITGASRGIGAATALLFAENGYDVVINFLKNRDKAEEVVKKAKSFGVRAIAIQADLEKEDEIVKMFSKIDEELGEISVLVNNGGMIGEKKAVAEIDFQYLQKVYSANVFGTFICCREALKRMKKNGGAIINLSSLSAKYAGFEMSAYASSKAAINNFTVGFAREAAQFGVRVNAVAPGVIDTDAHKKDSEERILHLQNSIPLKRIGKAKEVAEAIFWLSQESSSYVTGSILEITGGK